MSRPLRGAAATDAAIGTPAPDLANLLQGMNAIVQQQQAAIQLQQQASQHQAELAQAALAQHAQGGQRDAQQRLLKDFKGLHPPAFDGDVKPLDAHKWLQNIMKILDAKGAPNDRRVILASFQFGGEAEFWWESVLRSRGDGAPPMVWAEFERVFFEKYFPETVRDSLEEEFLALKQESLSVGQYEAKFEELSRYAPHLVDTDDRKSKRFEKGLKFSIRRQLASHMIRRYSEVVSRALAVEKDLEDASKVLGKRNNRSTDNQSRNQRKGPSNHHQPAQNLFLPVQERVCYTCRQTGHLRANCPSKATSLGNAPSPSSRQQIQPPLLPTPPKSLQLYRPPNHQKNHQRNGGSQKQGKLNAIIAQDQGASGN